MARKTEQTGIRSTLILILLSLSTLTWGQSEDLEYMLELGGGAGACFYMGDVNGTPYAHMSGMGSIVARRILNPRMAVKGNLAFGHISGTSDGYFIPTDANSQSASGGIPTKVSFSRNVIDFGAQFEMNFWGYGMGSGYKENSRITPYMLGGAGVTISPGGTGTIGALNLPIGVGVKYKIRPRLNIGLEWTMRFTTSDKLDVSKTDAMQLDHPYGVQSVGFKNKDCYSFTMLFVTYDMCPKYRKCNN